MILYIIVYLVVIYIYFIMIKMNFVNKFYICIYFYICRQTVAEFLDLTLLKDWVYDNIIFGMSLSFFADLTFFTLEPLFLDKANLSRVRNYNIYWYSLKTPLLK